MKFFFCHSLRRTGQGGFLAVLLLLAALPGRQLLAQTNAPVVSPGRYLFVVETSAAMRKRSENVQASIGNLITSSLHGQLRAGDSIGLWTFDDDLYTGQFPLQRWNPDGGQRIAPVMIDFLATQFKGRSADLNKAVHAMTDLMQRSEKITVLLFTEGREKVVGTPFDALINEKLQQHYAAQKKTRMPFVVVLRAQKGEIFGWRVCTPPWPVDFPPFAPEPAIEPVAKSAVQTNPPPAVAKKIEPPAPAANNPAITIPAVPPVPSAPVQIAGNETNAAPNPEPPLVASTATTPPPPEPVVIPPTPPPTPAEPPTPPATVAQVNSPPPSDPLPPPPTPPPDATTVIPQPPTRTVPLSQPPAVTPPLETPVNPSESAPSEPRQMASVKTPAANSPRTKAGEMPAPSGSTSAKPGAVSAPAATSNPTVKRTSLLIGGCALIIGAGILLVAQLRRPHRNEKVSLITHSIEREEK